MDIKPFDFSFAKQAGEPARQLGLFKGCLFVHYILNRPHGTGAKGVSAAGYIAMTAPGKPLEAIGPMRNPLLILVIAYTIPVFLNYKNENSDGSSEKLKN